MIEAITSFIVRKPQKKPRGTGGAPHPTAAPRPIPSPNSIPAILSEGRHTFSKVFRWYVPPGQRPQPTLVELAGSFNDWQRLPLAYDPPTRTWQITLDTIENNRTHHYAILVDGKPVYDKTCDGLAVPENPQEAQYEIQTEKGPRVMILFAQAK